MLATAVVAAIVLVGYERRRVEPLIDPRFFRSIPFSGATVTAVCAFGGFAGFLFLNTLYLQDVRGYSALVAGLCTLPLAAVTLVAAPLSGTPGGHSRTAHPAADRGLSAWRSGAVMLVRLSADTSIWWVLASYTRVRGRVRAW